MAHAHTFPVAGESVNEAAIRAQKTAHYTDAVAKIQALWRTAYTEAYNNELEGLSWKKGQELAKANRKMVLYRTLKDNPPPSEIDSASITSADQAREALPVPLAGLSKIKRLEFWQALLSESRYSFATFFGKSNSAVDVR